MNDETRSAIRSNARALGILLQGLAVATLGLTFYVAFLVAGFLRENVTGSNNEATTLIVLAIVAVGVFYAIILAAFGYTLSMLCVVYDQNDAHFSHTLSRLPTSAPTPSFATSATPTRATSPVPPRLTSPAPLLNRPTILGKPAAPAPETKSRLWRELTRERHFFR